MQRSMLFVLLCGSLVVASPTTSLAPVTVTYRFNRLSNGQLAVVPPTIAPNALPIDPTAQRLEKSRKIKNRTILGSAIPTGILVLVSLIYGLWYLVLRRRKGEDAFDSNTLRRVRASRMPATPVTQSVAENRAVPKNQSATQTPAPGTPAAP